MRSLYSLGENGPSKPHKKPVKKFEQKPLIGANKAINSFAHNGLFQATNIAATSNNRAVLQMTRDSRINKR